MFSDGSGSFFLSSFGGCRRQLIVFLCSFFFFELRLAVDSVLKILRFLISMFILILFVDILPLGVTALFMTLSIYFVGEVYFA